MDNCYYIELYKLILLDIWMPMTMFVMKEEAPNTKGRFKSWLIRNGNMTKTTWCL